MISPLPLESAASGASFVAGWYGKMPCLGDFASRRLPGEFIAAWDAWLQRSIAASRQQLGESWLDVFLKSPMWRFVLAPGVCGEDAYAGLLLPSVDKVGRYFPLTLVLPLQRNHADVIGLLSAQTWYCELEKIGWSALDADFSPDRLEAALADCPLHTIAPLDENASTRDMLACLRDHAPTPETFLVGSIDALPAAATAAARALVSELTAGKSYWWSVAHDTGATEFHCASGLPPDAYYTVLLGGSGMPDAPPLDPLLAFDSPASR